MVEGGLESDLLLKPTILRVICYLSNELASFSKMRLPSWFGLQLTNKVLCDKSSEIWKLQSLESGRSHTVLDVLFLLPPEPC